MAIQHLSTVLCEQARRDAQGRLTLAGVFTSIEASCFPAHREQTTIYVALRGQPGDPFAIALRLPDGREECACSGEVERPPDDQFGTIPREFQVIVDASNIGFDRAGVGAVLVQSGETLLHTQEFVVFASPGSEAEAETAERLAGHV